MLWLFEIDKEKFGSFVAQLRREKGLTQKDLAEKLFLSDKAVSKWERGLSLPDIRLLELRRYLFLAVILGSLFLPLYYVAKKYE